MNIDQPLIQTGQMAFGRRKVLRTGALVGGGLLVSPALAACGGASSSAPGAAGSAGAVTRGGTLKLATDSFLSTDSSDPGKSENDGMYLLQGCVREGIAWLDNDQVPHPHLATWTANSNFTTWTLKVRNGVKFHDGSTLTAHDLEWMIVRALDPKNGSSLNSRLASSLDTGGVKVVDDGTLELHCKQPDSALMGPLGRVAAFIVPKGTTNFNTFIGTGPYKLTTYTPGQGFSVAANPDYWQSGLPYLDGVQCLQVAEASTRVQGVLSGDTHGTEIDYQSAPTVKGASNVTISVAKNAALLNAAMDQTKDPFTDIRVRSALKYSLDRAKAIQIAYAGYGEQSADVPIAASDPQFPASLRSRIDQDLDKAQSLMAAAGHPDGLDLTLETPSDSLHSTFALAISTAVKGSPFTITVHQSDPSTYWDKVWMKVPFMTNDWNHRAPIELMPLMFDKTAAWNETRFNDARFERAIDIARRKQGSAQDVAIADAANQVADISGFLCPGFRSRIFAFKKNVHQADYDSSTTLNLTKAWIG